MITLLRITDFRRLWAGQALSMLGDRALWLVLGIWVYHLTGSSGAAGAIYLALSLPQLAGPLFGMLADRYPRRRLMIANDVATGLVVLALLLVHDRRDLWILYAVALAYGASQQLYAAARSGLVAGMVPDDLLGHANGLLESARSGVRIAGPAIGAAVYAFAGGGTVAALDALTFAISAILLGIVRAPDIAPARGGRPSLAEIGGGFGHLRRTPELGAVVPTIAIVAAAIGLSEVIPFALVAHGLHRSPSFLGVLATFGGAGAITGSLLAGGAVRRLGETRCFGLGTMLMAAGLALDGTGTLVGATVGTATLAVGLSGAIVAWITLLQRRTPSELQGRVFAAGETIFSLPYIASIAGGSAVISMIGYRAMCIAGTIVLLAAAARFLRPATKIVLTLEKETA